MKLPLYGKRPATLFRNRYILSSSDNRHENIKHYLTSSNLICALQSKNIVVSNLKLIERKTINVLEIAVFYRGFAIQNYKRNCKSMKVMSPLPLEFVKLLSNDRVKIKLIQLNKLVKEKQLTLIYKKFQHYINRLFVKKLSLFFELLKIVLLVADQKASIWALTYTLSIFFKQLKKQQHGTFLIFMNEIFSYLLEQNKNVLGVKMIITGRLKGKQRASLAKTKHGEISHTEYNANIPAGQCHIYTVYGCFGFKLWINFKKELYTEYQKPFYEKDMIQKTTKLKEF